MQRREASRLTRMKWHLSFLAARTMVMSFLVVVESMTLLPSDRANAQATHLIRNRDIMSAVVYDVTYHRYYTYNPPNQFITGSSMKVPIMLTFLDMIEQQDRGPTSSEMKLLTTMIENSNNHSASVLYGEIGGAVGVALFLQRIMIIGLYPNPNTWGYSLITPLAMVKLLTRLYEGSILTVHDRYLALYLMEHVEAKQRWGVGDTAPREATVAMKNGWVPAHDGLWAVNSSGIVMLGQETYIIAVYTKEEVSLEAGQIVIQQVCRKVVAQLL